MEVETKYNINDKVWFINPQSGMVVSGKIIEIKISIRSREIKKCGDKRDLIPTGEYKEVLRANFYYINLNGIMICKDEDRIFISKEHLINSL